MLRKKTYCDLMHWINWHCGDPWEKRLITPPKCGQVSIRRYGDVRSYSVSNLLPSVSNLLASMSNLLTSVSKYRWFFTTSGMVSQYYKPRWAFFIDRLRKCWQDPTYTFSQYQYEILNFIEIPFSTTKISFPVKENGTAILLSPNRKDQCWK